MRWAWLLCIAWITTLVLVVAPARADTARDEARALLKQGNDLVADGRYVEALEKFRAAHARFPSPKLVLNIGTTLRQLGRLAEAMDAYEEYLASAEVDPAEKTEVKRLLSEMSGKTARLKIRVDQPAQRLTLDGKTIAENSTAVERRVDPGSHVVVAERAGHPSAVERFEVSAGDHRELLLEIPDRDQRAPTQSKARISATERDRGSDSGATQRTFGWAALGIGAVGVGVGVVTGIMVGSKKRDLEDKDCTEDGCPATLSDEVDSYNQLRTISTVAFVVGAVGLAAGSVLLISAPSASARRLELRVGAAGGMLRGTF
jgi:tetratricopeptide (TPR) repeat protein